MRTFRNLAFVALLVILTPSFLNADGEDFCATFGQDGCSCESGATRFAGFCSGFESCAEHFPNYCENASLECLDHCADLHSGEEEPGPSMPQWFDCIEDFECSMVCECYPIE
jgi:hypothetical protein